MTKKHLKILGFVIIISIIIFSIFSIISSCMNKKNQDIQTVDIPATEAIPSPSSEIANNHINDESAEIDDGNINADSIQPFIEYGDTKIFTFDGIYSDDVAVEANMCIYIWRNLNNFVDYDCIELMNDGHVQNRGPSLGIVKNDTEKKIYIETDNSYNDNICYAKISNNFNSKINYYEIILTYQSDRKYDISHNEVDYDDISNNIINFTNKENESINDILYAKKLLDFYISIGGENMSWEGYDRPIDLEMMLEIIQ